MMVVRWRTVADDRMRDNLRNDVAWRAVRLIGQADLLIRLDVCRVIHAAAAAGAPRVRGAARSAGEGGAKGLTTPVRLVNAIAGRCQLTITRASGIGGGLGFLLGVHLGAINLDGDLVPATSS